MKRLTMEDIINFPKTTYGRALGKEIANQVMMEMLMYKRWETRLGIPLDALAQLIDNNCYFDGKDFNALRRQYGWKACEKFNNVFRKTNPLLNPSPCEIINLLEGK